MSTNAAIAATCGTGYGVVAHNIEFDFNIATLTPDAVTAKTSAIGTNTFILSDDGNCYAGYDVYSRASDDFYPLIEDSDLCADGYYRSNGNCVAYTSNGCPSGRHDAAVVNSTFVGSEDGSCYSGYDLYSRANDDIYPMIDSSTSVLCPSGQYMANGTCTSYTQSTCPTNYFSYSLNANTIAQQSNDACPSNYELYTTMSNCDVSSDPTCADIATIINLSWDDGNSNITTNTCTYGQTIVLPETPTRPGYVFQGWRLDTSGE